MEAKFLANEEWRLNNLYKIVDKSNRVVTFRMNRAQKEFYKNAHYRNLIPKARQLGFSTLFEIWALDRCLFVPNHNSVVICHTIDKAQEMFDEKVKFAYDRLPKEIRADIPAKRSSARVLALGNGSKLNVTTSSRSGTIQFLHISELAAVDVKDAAKSAEIMIGSVAACPVGKSLISVESTTQGRAGRFFTACEQARIRQEKKQPLTPLRWKLHFYNWMYADEYRAEPLDYMPEEYEIYFDMLKTTEGIELDEERKSWYVQTAEDYGDYMQQEFPTTYDEAFAKLMKGSIYGKQLARARTEGRVLDLPCLRGAPVHVAWDLGMADGCALWFFQHIGSYIHVLDFFEASLEDLMFYLEELENKRQKLQYHYGFMFLPHDGKARRIDAIAGSAQEILIRHGYKVRIVPKTQTKRRAIEDSRTRLQTCKFDNARCEKGLDRLAAYRWKYDLRSDTLLYAPVHDESSHAADSFQTLTSSRTASQNPDSPHEIISGSGGRMAELIRREVVLT